MKNSEATVVEPDQDLQATRWSLPTRLKNWDDQEGWREFFDSYWRLIYSVAVKAGLTDSERAAVIPTSSPSGPSQQAALRVGVKGAGIQLIHWEEAR